MIDNKVIEIITFSTESKERLQLPGSLTTAGRSIGSA